MEKLGTKYGGWRVPKKMELNESSICYLGGVGEDASFDILLQNKYGCHIFMIDPTRKASIHYNELITSRPFSGNIQPDYLKTIAGIKFDPSKLTYISCGLWNCKDELKFYRQDISSCVSQTLIEDMFSTQYDIVSVDTIAGIMDKFGHTHIDLLKLDIEGAECKTLEKMLDDKVYPRYILVEFDLHLKHKDKSNETRKIINRLISEGYKILCNDNMNITFERVKIPDT